MKAIFGEDPIYERQRRIVYAQIGIDPDINYSEEELEEYIVLKAVRDFNHSKFADTEHILIEGAIKDIFQGAVPDLDEPKQDYGRLKLCLHQSFEAMKIDYSLLLKTKALQFFEIQRSKHGCIIVGDPMSGKTTLVQLLE
jgi:dynein heavy chain